MKKFHENLIPTLNSSLILYSPLQIKDYNHIFTSNKKTLLKYPHYVGTIISTKCQNILM